MKYSPVDIDCHIRDMEELCKKTYPRLNGFVYKLCG